MRYLGLICECGFKFSGAGEYRNCPAFVTTDGQSGVVCPKCNNSYVDGDYVGKFKEIFKQPGELLSRRRNNKLRTNQC
jgi:hypothetical protein